DTPITTVFFIDYIRNVRGMYAAVHKSSVQKQTTASLPGDGGSQLEANLTGKPTVVHYICSKQTSDYFDLWLNLELFTPLIHCLYGIGIDTAEQFNWAKGYFPDYQPYVMYGDGDGTVNRKSAEVCLGWNKANNHGKP
ncbi:hypothetical protein TELCIR_18815, partial [Teladorsagia circumcincta]